MSDRIKIPTECISWRWHGNLGDDLIWDAQEQMFAHALDLQQYCSDPRAVLIGGGTFIPKFPQNPDLLLLSRRIPTAAFGTGVGDPLFWGNDHIPTWLEILGNANFVGVRGPLSAERLVEWGFPPTDVSVVGDTGLYFASDQLPRVFEQRHVAVNVGTAFGNLYGGDEAALEQCIVSVLMRLVAERWKVSLVSAWKPDDEMLFRIAEKVSVAGVELWHDNFHEALDSISKFDCVLSEKLHVGVIAACRGIPFVALNYRSKVLDFCRSIDWQEFCVDIEPLAPEAMYDRLVALSRSRQRYASRLMGNVMLARDRLMSLVPRVISALCT